MLTSDLSVVAPAATGERLLDLDTATFRDNFSRRPFLIGHHLAGHALFTLPRLVALAQRLPEKCIEYNAGDVPVNLDPGKTPRTGLSVEETICRIEECRSWLVLKHVEQDPEYAELLNRCIDEMQVHSEPLFPGVTRREGFIFVSSPGSVTPYHVDPEHNFLLQVRGTKTVHIFDGNDRSVLSEEELENYYSGAHRNLTYREVVEAKAQRFELTPGLGLHFPLTFPHWVKNGEEVSVSFSITFRTPDLDKRAAVYEMNARTRKRGRTPTPFGASPWRDSLKFLGYRLARRAGRLLGRGKR